MADLKISQLTAATTPLAGTEVLPIVQSSTTVKVAVSDLTAGRAISATAATLSSGNLNFSGTAQRITGDFSNATLSNRLYFQTSTTNGTTSVSAIPNGTAVVSSFNTFNASDPANSALLQLQALSTETRLNSNAVGTGTYLPMTIYTGGSERVRIDTSGNVGIGTASPSYKVDVSGTLGVSSDISIGTASDVNRVIGRVGTYSIGVRSLTLRAGSTSDNTSGTGGAYITLTNALNAGGTYGTIHYSANDGGAGTAAHIWGVNGTERMRIDSSGNVGIGTASPGSILHVYGGAGTNIAIQSSAGNQWRIGDAVGASNGTFVIADYTNSQSAWQYVSGASGAHKFYTAGTERMRIDSSGNLTCAGVYSATVGATNRDVYVDNTGLIGYVSSIRASKTNIAPLDNPSWLLQLQPVTFNYRAKDKDGKYTDTPDGPQQYGLIAEDVEAVAPDLCYYDEVEGQQELRGINYSRLITPLLKLVQDQQALINDLTARVRALEAKG